MKRNFEELWGRSRAFRQLFIHNGIFEDANKVDVAKAEVMWWDRYPRLDWAFCGQDDCPRLVVKGERCEKHSESGQRSRWKWSQGVLYRFMAVPYFKGDKGNDGGRIYEYVAYHLHQARKVFEEIPPGFNVHYADGNPFNLRTDNLILLSSVILAAVQAGVVSIGKALELDDVLMDELLGSLGRGRRKAQWVYTIESIAKAAGVAQSTIRADVSPRGILDPNDLRSIASYIHQRMDKRGGSLSKLRKIG
jgi:hypothetical protein